METKVVARDRGDIALETFSAGQALEGEVAGPTIVSLVSPGTELAIAYGEDSGFPLPAELGYAAAFRVSQVGHGADGIALGDIVMSMGPHASWQRQPAERVVVLPVGLDPAKAVFARMINISMSGIVTSSLRPGMRPAVMGLGLVGQLAVRALLAQGYAPIAVDRSVPRRALLPSHVEVRERLDESTADVVFECSGRESAVLDAVRGVSSGGEVVLCGLAWSPRSEVTAFELLNAVFRKFAVVRSGWEWQLPWRASANRAEPDLRSTMVQSLAWLGSGALDTDGLADVVEASEAPEAYARIKRREGNRLSFLIDWGAGRHDGS